MNDRREGGKSEESASRSSQQLCDMYVDTEASTINNSVNICLYVDRHKWNCSVTSHRDVSVLTCGGNQQQQQQQQQQQPELRYSEFIGPLIQWSLLWYGMREFNRRFTAWTEHQASPPVQTGGRGGGEILSKLERIFANSEYIELVSIDWSMFCLN